ncbi:MAG: DUF58 domain-containing protein [Leptonema sp. (in: Bacteria)]|nr:DUF58 domain-containing protein [Leptonema sp. (in: bacteria)]
MILPSKLALVFQLIMVVVCAIITPFLLSAREFETALEWFAILEFVLIALIFIDGGLLTGKKDITVIRKINGQMTVGKPVAVELRFEPKSWFGKRRLRYTIFDGINQFFEANDLPIIVRSRPPFSIGYQLIGVRRGRHTLHQVLVTVQSRFGFSLRRFQLDCTSQVSVHSSIPSVSGEFILSQKKLYSMIGNHKRSVPGGEREFYRLRDYQVGDEPRRIDWKASAKQGQLITREYEQEQKQTLFIVVDTGRWMSLRSGGQTLLDEALSAALMLTGVASSNGDSVGFLAYGSKPQLYLPPGRRDTKSISAALCSLQTESNSLNTAGLTAFVSGVLRFETILCLFSTVPSESGVDNLIQFSSHLVGKQRPLLILLENDQTVELLAQSQNSEMRQLSKRNNLFPLPEIEYENDEAYIAFQYLKEKERRLRFAAHRRSSILMTTREKLNLTVLSQYLQMRYGNQ